MPQAVRAGGVFPAGSKSVSPLNTEMIPGAGSSSVDLQLVSADLFPPDTTLDLHFSSHSGYVPRWRKQNGRSNFERCLYHLLVNLLINILCQKSLVQLSRERTGFSEVFFVKDFLRHYCWCETMCPRIGHYLLETSLTLHLY